MANLLNQASIVLTPTAYNNGEALCIKPDDASGDFQFSRNSAATRVNAQGLDETIGVNLPRINYENGCGSWLFEPQSTNLITYSEDFSVPWLTSESTIADNYGVSPSGNNDASRWLSDLGASNSVLTFGPTVSDNTAYTISFYVKSNGNNKDVFRLIISSGADGLTSNDLTATSEWQRFTYSGTRLTTGSRFGLIFPSDNSEVDVQIWGAQVENQSYATSYIPTSGSQVTRNQDVCNNGGSLATINSTEGVLYAEIAALANDGTFRSIGLSDGTINNRIIIFYSDVLSEFRAIIAYNGIFQTVINTNINVTDTNKIAFKYRLNDVALWINGVEISVDNSATMPLGLNRLSFDRGDGANNFFGKTKCVAVFPYLTDAELTELTTI
jgi:hypothetical protein